MPRPARPPRPRRARPRPAAAMPPGDLTGTEFEVEVGPVAAGGGCVARVDRRVVFVRHAIPGERVRARVTAGGRTSRFLRADAVEILSPSPDRVPPPCPYAGPGRCGGCDWQHVSLPAQRRFKAALLGEQLRRLAGVAPEVVVEELPGHPDGLGWRTRVGFAADADGRLGLRGHRSSRVEPVERCLIAHPLVDDLGVTRRRWPGADTVAVAVSAGSGQRAVTVVPAAGAAAVVPPLDAPAAVLVGDGSGPPRPLRGRGRLREVAAGRSWQVDAGGFWQVHPGAADALVAAVADMLDPRPGDRVLDLFAGAGLFAGALAERVGPAGAVTAIEGDAGAAARARENLRGLPVTVLAGDAAAALRAGGVSAADLVVLDPPRAGAGGAVCAALSRLAPRAIAYVACDPAALGRDVATFAGYGYRLRRLRAFDLFPMTAHVECVALLAPGPAGPGLSAPPATIAG